MPFLKKPHLNDSEETRREYLYSLRIAGLSYSDIRNRLFEEKNTRYSFERIKRLIAEHIEIHNIVEPFENIIYLELSRIDQAIKAINPEIVKGNMFAIDRLLKLLDRRAKYLGLDKPIKQEMKTTNKVIVIGGDEFEHDNQSN